MQQDDDARPFRLIEVVGRLVGDQVEAFDGPARYIVTVPAGQLQAPEPADV